MSMFQCLQIRDTDLDMLEKVVGIVAFGDLDREDTCNLTDLNFLRIFRLSQLTAEYLLHVQDHLAQENSQLKVATVRQSSQTCTFVVNDDKLQMLTVAQPQHGLE